MARSEHSLSKFRFIHLLFISHKQHNDWFFQLPKMFQIGEIAPAIRANLLKKLFLVSRTDFEEFLKKLELVLRRLNFWIRDPLLQDFNLIFLQVTGLPIVIPVLIARHSDWSRYFITSPPSLLCLFWKYYYADTKRFTRI